MVDAERKLTDIQVTQGDATAYTADIVKALENQSAEGLEDSGFRQVLWHHTLLPVLLMEMDMLFPI